MDIVLNKANFDAEVVKSAVPVLVDFWAPWCGPCRMQDPILKEVAASLGAKAKIGKVNVDDNQELAGEHNVMSIPTLKLFNKGQVVAEMVGVQSKDKLVSEITKLLSQ